MEEYEKNFMKKVILLVMSILLSTACASIIKIKQDPFYGSFYKKTSFIMTKEEIKIYKHLPDKESKREFIEEFWRIRDPNPATEENEIKIEFENRIEYANKWFGRWNPYRGRDTYQDKEKLRGWNTDRGRIYIILGHPDQIISDGYLIRSHEDRRTERGKNEIWYYYHYNLGIGFTMISSGEMRLTSSDSALQHAIEDAKLNMITTEFRGDIKRKFKFKAKFEDNMIVIMIPVTRISFQEKNEKLNFKFRITINVYHNNKKIDKIEDTKILSESEDELLKKKNILLEIPYEPTLKGKYYFDIIVEDLMSMSFSKYRNFVNYRH